MRSAIKIVYLLLFVSTISFSQERIRYFIEIPNQSYVPQIVAKNGNEIEIRVANALRNSREINELLDSFTVFDFLDIFQGSDSNLLRNKYVIDVSDRDDLMSLVTQFSGTFVSVEREYEFPTLAIENPPLETNNPPSFTPNDYEGAYLTQNIKISNYDDYERKDLDMIRAKEAWALTKGGSDKVVLGVSDQGFDLDHEDFKSEFVGGVGPYGDQTGSHGNRVAGFLSARTNNGIGISSIGFRTKMIGARGGSLSNLLQLAQYEIKPKAVNLSFGSESSYNQSQQDIVNMIHDLDVTVVVAGGNGFFSGPSEDGYYYPASYENVIAVSSVGNKHEIGSTAIPYENWKDVHYTYHYDEETVLSHQHNDSIDIVVPLYYPGPGLFRDPDHNDPYKDDYRRTGLGGTSFSAPIVVGTIGLMHSVNYCLKPNEVETILKLTAVKVDTIPENLPYYGQLGAGRLDAYEAVKMAKDMKDVFGTVEVKDRILYRPWFYKLETAPYEIHMIDNNVTQDSKIKFRARNNIEILSGTYFPGDGYIDLQINPDLTSCELPSGFNGNTGNNDIERTSIEKTQYQYEVVPTLVENNFSVTENSSYGNAMHKIEVYNLFNQLVLEKSTLGKSNKEIDFTKYNPGIYIVKIYNANGNELFTSKIVKK